jgi:preprotein translocase subunit SecD
MRSSIWKLAVIIIICFLSVLFALPNFINTKHFSFLPSSQINYGLDLKGGSHLLLKVDFQSYLNDQLSILTDLIRKELRSNKISYSNLKQDNTSITFSLKNENDYEHTKKILSTLNKNTSINIQNNRITVSYTPGKIEELQDNLIEQSREIIRLRIDETGTLDPSIQRQGKNHILVQAPGLQDPAEIKKILGKTAKMTFHLVDENVSADEIKNNFVPLGSKIVKGEKNDNGQYFTYVIKSKVLLSGDLLTNASAMIQNGNHVVTFEFNRLGAKLFADVTKNNPGKHLAIVIDDTVVSAPVINEPILGGSGIIQGNFTAKNASELALLLRAGALPAPFEIVEERIVGPTLGEDSIQLGKEASLTAIIAVIVFMVAIYGIYGVFASTALIFNLFLLISIITLLQVTLTLPGIAGIVLTMGMAVDTNVLIFERIKEELDLKSSFDYAIKRGFSQAFATILDSNLTTLIAAFFLYAFGTGVVKSFSVTLTVGILSSMFTAITLTKLLIAGWIAIKKPK